MGIPDAPIDIQARPQNHNPDAFDEVEAIVDNVSGALTYRIE
jgi:hypothetical protein